MPPADAAPGLPGEVAVIVEAPGRSSEQIEADLVLPLEEALAPLGARWLRAVAAPGRAELRLGHAGDAAARDALSSVRDAVTAAATRLPDDVSAPRVEVVGRSSARLVLDQGEALSSIDAIELGASLGEALAATAGVRGVRPCAPALEVSATLDPARMSALSVDVAQVVAALRRAPLGGASPEALGAVEVAARAGASVRLADLARISLGARPGGCEVRSAQGRLLVLLEVDTDLDPAALAAGLAARLPAGASVAPLRVDAEVIVPGGAEEAEAGLAALRDLEGRAIAAMDPAGWWSPGQFPPGQPGRAVRFLVERRGPVRPGEQDLAVRLGAATRAVQATPPPLAYRVDRDRAAELGVASSSLSLAIQALAGGVVVSRDRSPSIRIEVGPGHVELARISVVAAKGMVPLGSLVSAAESGPPIVRADRKRLD